MLITSIPQFIQGLTNAKIDLTADDVVTLYTAPSSSDFNVSIINSILVANDNGTASTITVTLVGNGVNSTATVTDHSFVLFQVKAVAANTTIELLTQNLIVKSGEIIQVKAADDARLHVVASIQEFIKQRISTSAVL